MRLAELIGTFYLDLKDMMRPTRSFVDSIIFEYPFALRYLNLIQKLPRIFNINPCLADTINLISDGTKI